MLDEVYTYYNMCNVCLVGRYTITLSLLLLFLLENNELSVAV